MTFICKKDSSIVVGKSKKMTCFLFYKGVNQCIIIDKYDVVGGIL